MKFDDARTVGAGQLQRIDAGHRDVAGVEHKPDVPGIGSLHDGIDLAPVLELSPQVRVHPKPQALAADALAEIVEDLGHLLQIFIGSARGPARSSVDL